MTRYFYFTVEEIDEITTTPTPEEDSVMTVTEFMSDAEATTQSPEAAITMLPAMDASVSACAVDGVVYEDGEDVSVQNTCQESCTCISGELMCILKKCPDKPPSFLRCSVVRAGADECCPSYNCRK